ncbi:MAG TPA: cytochrome c oxidase subunit II [Geobacterales bacterium]|nr:cytochrome c oxidase subunit II [Geobacterales bacterium]
MTARVLSLVATLCLAMFSHVEDAFAAIGAPSDWQINLPDSVTPMLDQIKSFNELVLIIIVAVVLFVMGLLAWVMIRYRESVHPVPSRLSHNTTLEVLWTIVPVLVLAVIAIPSFRLLFHQFDFPKPDLVVKATGKQWYWSYEYPDAKVAFDSYPVDDKDLKPGQIRNLSVDNDMVVPVNKVVQVLITGGDVIHQWVVPSFGTRADGIPGRINRTWFLARELGIYYGECSALCGQGHAYMPIAVRVVSDEDFSKWISEKQKSASLEKNQMAAADPAPVPAR